MNTLYTRSAIIRWFGLLLVVATQAAYARDGADPAINRPYLDPDFSQWVERFERPGREVFDQRQAIVVASGVRPGTRVADVGASTGLFSRCCSRTPSVLPGRSTR